MWKRNPKEGGKKPGEQSREQGWEQRKPKMKQKDFRQGEEGGMDQKEPLPL